jgi:dTDP-4-amino-4,6-dideoxygalactose transaminase
MISLHEPLFKGNEQKYIKNCLEKGWVSSAGEYVNTFEKKIAKYTGAKYAVACINGTAALQISLKLVGVKKDDEVIVPSMTFIAAINSITYNNAKPIFMDCDKYYTININKTLDFLNKETRTIKKKVGGKNLTITINKKTGNRISAVIIVHVFGNAVKIDKLLDLCRKKNVALVEDAAESIGSFYIKGKYKKKHTGTLGDIGCLSFNGNKIITTGGGGMILTNNKKVANKAKYITNQAKDDPIYSIHNEVGYNFRLPNVLAALGLAQLESLSKYIKKKK